MTRSILISGQLSLIKQRRVINKELYQDVTEAHEEIR